MLPDSLHTLKIGFRWRSNSPAASSDELPLRLPPAITTFTLPESFPTPLLNHILLSNNCALGKLWICGPLTAGTLRDVAWPPSLHSLTLYDDCEPGALSRVDWPPSLSRLQFGFGMEAELHCWTPPVSVTHLILEDLPLDCSSIRWPPRMQRLSLYSAQHLQPSSIFHWPASLTSMFVQDWSSWQ